MYKGKGEVSEKMKISLEIKGEVVVEAPVAEK